MEVNEVAKNLLLGENCECCWAPGASLTYNPYEADVNDDYTEHWICDDCLAMLADEV